MLKGARVETKRGRQALCRLPTDGKGIYGRKKCRYVPHRAAYYDSGSVWPRSLIISRAHLPGGGSWESSFPSPFAYPCFSRRSPIKTLVASSKPIFMAWIRLPSLYKRDMCQKIIRATCFSIKRLKIVVKKGNKMCTLKTGFVKCYFLFERDELKLISEKIYIYVFLLTPISWERWIRIDSRLALLVR